ncbi:hypothetical protein JW859_14265 [bacterium]|nr:hypothetical protein [bacterium]
MKDNRAASLPESVWDGYDYTSVHTVVLVAGIEHFGAVANTLPPSELDWLVNLFQEAMLNLVLQCQDQGLCHGEVRVTGGKLMIGFYDEKEVARNYLLDGPASITGDERQELIKRCRESNADLVVDAIKTAIRLMNLWLIQPENLRRVRFQLAPYQLGIGLHSGRAFLRNRPDGSRRIEGYTVTVASELQRQSVLGKFSHILLTRRVYDILLKIVRQHTQLRQRVFFQPLTVDFGGLHSSEAQQEVLELQFYHRIGIHITQEVIDQYEALFALDHANIWAYYQLVDYYAFTAHNWTRVFELAKIAQLVHPNDPKILLDLAKYYFHINKLDQSQVFAEQALKINDQFDLAHEHLAVIADKRGDVDAQIEHWRAAVYLSPGSPINNFNLGLSLLLDGDQDDGYHFIQEAIRLYPGYVDWQIFRETLQELNKKGKLPELLQEYIHFDDNGHR